jgi:hypothetical protein
MIYAHRCHFIRSKRNFLEASDLDNAALAGDDLIVRSAVSEFHRNDLIPYTGLAGVLEVVDKPTRYWN